MNTKKGPMKAILTSTIAALLLLSACGSDADSAADSEADETPVTEAEPVTTTAVEPEPEPESDPDAEANAALEDAVAEFVEAFGVSDPDEAWTFVSARCRDGISEAPADYNDFVAGWALKYPGATAQIIMTVVDGDRAAMTYDVFDGDGAFAESYVAQPWEFSDGNWHQDHC